jgi:hypothetical protein
MSVLMHEVALMTKQKFVMDELHSYVVAVRVRR